MFSTKYLPYNLEQFLFCCYFSICPLTKEKTVFGNSHMLGGRLRDWDDGIHPGRLASWKEKD